MRNLFFLAFLGYCDFSVEAFSSTVASTSSTNVLKDFDYQTNDKLPWIESGYQTWNWRGHKINYIELGDPSKPALVLIHGFGASAFHYRYNMPDLARDYHVYAFCKLGFGLSDKPVQEYAAEVWRDQAVDFLQQVVRKPAVLAGNSLGGFTSLYTAATEDVKDMVKGVVLMNGAGRFRDGMKIQEETPPNGIVDTIKKFIQRAVIAASFLVTKQPARIEQILRQVYPINAKNVDPELVESIRFPSLDPNAAEVFYRVITKNGSGPQVYVDDLLEKVDAPILLCWGEYDPWIKSEAADKIQKLKPDAIRVSIEAGHCPHDEAPEAVNMAIRSFMEQVVDKA
ncbi:alpha/beta fold family hydrolase [Nitzschia inconspicua]|uniref:Alpha/beta fold family hydrolase n=1 Tax=Nitzschia inconspicua TaxID=303405 RepID=A0A9K3LSV5_9STRA|nr:alpha/beta fold family hydrolase [Nitzschia inconspicua]